MRVLHVIASMDPATGGPCQGLRNTIPNMKRFGSIHEVVCLDSPNSSYLGKDEFKIYAIGKGISSWRFNKDLIPWLEKNLLNYDKVVLNGLWSYTGYALKKALNKLEFLQTDEVECTRIPDFYVMPHGMLDPYFQKASGRKFKAIRNWFYWKLIENKIVNSAKGILFTCEEELRLAREPFRPYKPKNEYNVGYGITSPPIFTQKLALAFAQKCPQVTNYPYFLFLSRIHEKKGLDILVKAYSKVLDSSPSGHKLPKLVIAGPGLNSTYGKYIKQISSSTEKLRNSIYFPGMLAGDSKWGAIYGCESFILPSHQENFGIAVAEALACGKPVLISNKVNIWYEIETGKGGIVTDDTLKGTIELIEYWQKLTDKRKQKMAYNAKILFDKNFSIEPFTKRLYKAINS
jgi:glycosyltransferase involved in cell wall biosynthesis